jgi:hypothetical protein
MQNAESSRTRQWLNSAEPAERRLLFFLSAALNVALLLFFAFVFAKSAPTPDQSQPTDHATRSERISRTHRKRIATRISKPSPWSQLESTDLTIYAANLRAAGCPPKTVRDILLPLVEEKFARRQTFAPELTNFWASFSERRAATAARAEKENELEKEKEKMLIELFGFPWTSEGLNRAYAGEAAGSLGFLAYERAEKFLCIAEKFKKQFSQGNLSHRIDHCSEIYELWQKEVSEVFSPSEFEEVELRGLLMIFQRRNPNLCNAGLNGSELRQLMFYRRELCKPLPSALLAGGDELAQEPDWGGEQEFNAKARGLLGDSRFIDYLKSCDASMEKTLAVLEKEQLPRSLALQLFDLRQEALSRAREIRLLPERRAEKRAGLAALRQSALEQLANLPDIAIESPLLEVNREWLQEIANP